MMRALRRTGIAICAILVGITLGYGIVDLTHGGARGGGSNLGFAGLFGVSAVLLWRRGGRRQVAVAFVVLMLYLLVLYFVLFELHTHGYLHGMRTIS